MILLWFILILMAGGLIAWIVAQWSKVLCRWISLLALLINFVIAVIMWLNHSPAAE